MKPGQSPRRRLSTERRRAEILDAAKSLYTSGTYSDVSVADVAVAAGVSEGLVYHYFRSKAALYTAAFVDLAEGLVEQQARAVNALPHASTQDRIKHYIHAHLDYIAAFPLAWATPFTGGDEPPGATEVRQQMRGQYVERLDDLLGPGSGIARTYALWGFVAYCEYAGVVWVVRGCPDDEREVIVAGALGALEGSLATIDQ